MTNTRSIRSPRPVPDLRAIGDLADTRQTRVGLRSCRRAGDEWKPALLAQAPITRDLAPFAASEVSETLRGLRSLTGSRSGGARGGDVRADSFIAAGRVVSASIRRCLMRLMVPSLLPHQPVTGLRHATRWRDRWNRSRRSKRTRNRDVWSSAAAGFRATIPVTALERLRPGDGPTAG
jgi:hypothetical protein